MAFRPLTSPSTTPSGSFRPLGGTPPAAPAPAAKSLYDLLHDSYSERLSNMSADKKAYQSGEEGIAQASFNAGGQVVGAANDTILNVAKKVLPEVVKKPIRTALGFVNKGINKVADKLSDTTFMKEAAAGAPSELPIERTLKAIPEYASLLTPEAAGGMQRVLTSGIKRAADPIAASSDKVATKVATSVGGKAPFAGSFDATVARDFATEGITPPISAVTKSPFLKGAEALAGKSAFGQKVTDIAKDASSMIDQRTQAVVERIKPQKTISDENLGKTMQEGIQEYETHFKTTMSDFYERFGEIYGKNPTPITETQATLQSVIAEQGQDLFKGVDPRVKGLLDRLVGENSDTSAMRKSGFPEILTQDARTPASVDFGTLKATRTAVGEALAKEPDNAGLKRVYGALSKDMESSVQNFPVKKVNKNDITIDDPEAVAAKEEFAKINDAYKSGKAKIEGQIASSISQSNPERIAQNLVKRNSAETLKTLKGMIGDTRYAELSKAFMRSTLEDSITRGKFDVAKLKAKLSEYDDATLIEIMSPEQKTALDAAIVQLEKLDRLGEALKPGLKISEGSQTAFLNKTSRISAALGALGTGNVPGFVAILGSLGADYGLSKLFTTKTGKKILTGGGYSEESLISPKSLPSQGEKIIKQTPKESPAATDAQKVIPKTVPQTKDWSINDVPAKNKKNIEDFFKGMPEKDNPPSFRPDGAMPPKPVSGQKGRINFGAIFAPTARNKAKISSLQTEWQTLHKKMSSLMASGVGENNASVKNIRRQMVANEKLQKSLR